MRKTWLYILIVLYLVIMFMLGLINMYSKTPVKAQVSRDVVPNDGGRFIRTANFVGVERSNIIFEVTKKGE